MKYRQGHIAKVVLTDEPQKLGDRRPSRARLNESQLDGPLHAHLLMDERTSEIDHLTQRVGRRDGTKHGYIYRVERK